MISRWKEDSSPNLCCSHSYTSCRISFDIAPKKDVFDIKYVFYTYAYFKGRISSLHLGGSVVAYYRRSRERDLRLRSLRDRSRDLLLGERDLRLGERERRRSLGREPRSRLLFTSSTSSTMISRAFLRWPRECSGAPTVHVTLSPSRIWRISTPQQQIYTSCKQWDIFKNLQ